MKHQGNWTCQLQLANNGGNWLNSTNSVTINVQSDIQNVISSYLARFFEGLFLSIESITDMINEIDN